MYLFVAIPAERDEVLFRVDSKQATSADMVNLEIGGTAPVLTPPSIACQHLPAMFSIGSRVRSKPRPLGP